MYLSLGVNNGAMINKEVYVYTWGLGEYGNLGNRLYTSSQNLEIVGEYRLGLNTYNLTIRKNETFDIEHVYSNNYNAMKAHYLFIQFAHTIRQLLEKGLKYIKDMKKDRKFDGVTIEREMMLFLEELGELAKAIRKNTNGHLDIAKEYNDNVEEELADCFIYLLSIANMNNVDIFKAFKDKETKNCDRVWK